ncbi:MAG: hypothetical protein K6T63_11935 [Alicyclobacillus herbarius]|uniref:hypothetical protein n=1 Tax=Alicyclobacillus herbarius TaxID=122960 RepID=UPI0023542EAA|nr:hypothetical protein [Alicyclobacillus herbarius]MCL6633327.1 hypothetical protein [Alicyclobacillus herbarius]
MVTLANGVPRVDSPERIFRCLGMLKTVLEHLSEGHPVWTGLLPERVAPILTAEVGFSTHV